MLARKEKNAGIQTSEPTKNKTKNGKIIITVEIKISK